MGAWGLAAPARVYSHALRSAAAACKCHRECENESDACHVYGLLFGLVALSLGPSAPRVFSSCRPSVMVKVCFCVRHSLVSLAIPLPSSLQSVFLPSGFFLSRYGLQSRDVPVSAEPRPGFQPLNGRRTWARADLLAGCSESARKATTKARFYSSD